jgi:hypothetical protein
MTDTPASKALTESLLSLVGQQRHYGARVLIRPKSQPSTSPRLIDLCTITVIHCFSSPEWMNVLKKQISVLKNDKANDSENSICNQILRLKTGEALVFASSAVVRPSAINDEMTEAGEQNWTTAAKKLIHTRIRKWVTWDGGASIVCV